MLKEYSLQGLNCPTCAAKIEAAVHTLDGVVSATLVFASASLRVQLADGYHGEITPMIENAVRLHEPDIIVLEKTPAVNNPEPPSGKLGEYGRELARLLAGVGVLALAVLFPEFLRGQVPAQTLTYISLAAFIAAYLILGADVLWNAAKNIVRKQILDENFLMGIATLGAFAINEPAEAVSVMLFYKIGEFFQDIAVDRSKKSITALMDLRPDYANLKRDGSIIRVSPDTLRAGDVIIVKPGEKIPLDGIVLEGSSMLDTSALTGESVPRRANPGDAVLSGCLNQNGVLTIEVQKTFGESAVAKIISLMENAVNKKAKTENFITRFAKYYTPAVVGCALLLAAAVPLFFGGDWREWLQRGLVFLVISCPCALVLSIPLSFFSGIGRASKSGILVKGGNYLEACTHLDTVVFDKTGTLTKGVFKVTALYPAPGTSERDLLALAASAEAFSNHPIALSIMQAYGSEPNRDDLTGYTEYAGSGVSVVRGNTIILAGNQALMEQNAIAFQKHDDTGTLIYVARDGVSAGCLVIADEIKPDSRGAIELLKKRGVRKTVMLSGDRPQIAASVAQTLGLDEAYGGLLPQEKAAKLQELAQAQPPGAKIAFAGDGINDAPVLAAADVGIAMGGLGSDAALEAADVVLMTDEPSKIGELVDISRRTMVIVRQNIVFALGVKAAFLALGALGMASMWEAVFADVGVSLLVVLNAMRVALRRS